MNSVQIDEIKQIGADQDRRYILESLLMAAKEESNEVLQFALDFAKLHSDSNVEIR